MHFRNEVHFLQYLYRFQKPYFKSGWEQARSQLGTRVSVVFQCSSCQAETKLVPNLAKNTASEINLITLKIQLHRRKHPRKLQVAT